MKKELTKEQREEAIQVIIENDMEQFYKPRDIYMAFYEGILPYKNMSDMEIIERYQDWEIPLPEVILKQ